jgi:hypothetical protein
VFDPPAEAESGMAFLTSDKAGSAYVSWIDPLPGGGHAVRHARWTGQRWSAAGTIASGKNWFVNWADFPSLAVFPDGSMMAHWLTKSPGAGAYGYGIRVARKPAGSTLWNEIFGAGLDNREDYAGFLSFVGMGNSAGAVYQSPPSGGGAHIHAGSTVAEHRKTLRFVDFSHGGAVKSDREIDVDTCSCCQTTAVSTSKGVVVAYRDHMPGEIRDISVVRLVNGVWTQSQPLYRDGWTINGCPTEGPSAAAQGESIGIAWLTRAQENPRVQMAVYQQQGAMKRS